MTSTQTTPGVASCFDMSCVQIVSNSELCKELEPLPVLGCRLWWKKGVASSALRGVAGAFNIFQPIPKVSQTRKRHPLKILEGHGATTQCKSSTTIDHYSDYSCLKFLVHSSCWQSGVKSSCVRITPLWFFLRNWCHCCRRCDWHWALPIGELSLIGTCLCLCGFSVEAMFSLATISSSWFMNHHWNSWFNSFYTFLKIPSIIVLVWWTFR